MSDDTETPQTGSSDSAAPEEGPVKTVESVEAELAALKDTMLRALAEAENGRRRAEREAAEGRVYAIDRFARDLLSVADNLGRALGSVTSAQAAPIDDAFKTLVDGVAMTEAALIDVFSRHGLKRLGAKGEKFDPNLHQAVAQIPSDAPAGAIADVFQPGYVLGDRTLRAAMVAVSLGQSANDGPTPSAENGGTIDIKV